ncbi:MAG: agmatinase family protein [Bacteroidetes bacterium]|nr:agmatinase family protein [Bacteroidota bacterium]
MIDITNYDPNSVGNPNNNIFGLPTTEDDARLIIVPVPWEVTVSYGAGTARAAEAMFKASLQVDLYDPEFPDTWQQGYFMRATDKKILMKSDYLRKEAELFIDYISKGEEVLANSFMCKTLKEVNEGGHFLNHWVYEQTKALLDKNKLVAVLGGDHSTPLGFFKAIGEKHGEFGILQIDAHLDLRKAYEGFTYSHASIMYNALTENNSIVKLVQAGSRDFGSDEFDFIQKSNGRVVTYQDRVIRRRTYEGESWKNIAEEIVSHLPQKVYISFDIDGLDRKLCPFTGTPVPGGFELEQVFYLFTKVYESGRQIIGFDLNEVGIGGDTDWDANVGARALYKMCNLLVAANSEKK